MQLDMDLARAILSKVNDSEKCDGLGWLEGEELRFGEHSAGEVAYHVMLLHEGGLILAKDLSNGAVGLMWHPRRLTWAGHQFLENSRSDSLWGKALKLTREKTGGLSFDVVKAVLAKLAVDAAVSQLR